MRISRLSPLRLPFVLAAALVALYFLLATSRLELASLDLRYYLASNSTEELAVSDSVAVVMVDRESEERLDASFGSGWRVFYPQLLDTLTAAGARLVVFDAELLAEEPTLDPELAAALRRSGRVVAGEIGDGKTAASLVDAFAAIGSLSVDQRGGIPRRVSRLPTGSRRPALAFMVAELVEPSVAAAVDDSIWINFAWPQSYFPTFSFADVYEAAAGRLADANGTPLAVFRDRVVVVGVSAGTVEAHRLPNTLGQTVSGVFGQAAAIEGLLTGQNTRRAGPLLDLLWLFGVLVLIQVSYLVRGNWALPTAIVLTLAASAVLHTLLLRDQQLWLSSSAIVVGVLALLPINGVSCRLSLLRNLRAATGLEPALIESFRREAAQSPGGVVERPAAVLIPDIRDFTYYTRTHSSSEVAAVLQEHFAAMEGAIGSEGGYVNNYVGDEIVAVFGFPYDGERCSTRAVLAAVGMLAEFRKLLLRWSQRDAEPLPGMGIGVDAGVVSFAQIGGGKRSQFDIVGDAINGASRIQDQTKELSRELLISEEVYGEIAKESHVRDHFAPVGNVGIRGQGQRLLYSWTERSPSAVEDLESLDTDAPTAE